MGLGTRSVQALTEAAPRGPRAQRSPWRRGRGERRGGARGGGAARRHGGGGEEVRNSQTRQGQENIL